MGKYLDIARKFAERQRTEQPANLSPSKALPCLPGQADAPELLAVVASAPVWRCPECGAAVRYDLPDDAVPVFPSRFWACTGCTAWGTTRDGAPYPVAWIVTRTLQ